MNRCCVGISPVSHFNYYLSLREYILRVVDVDTDPVPPQPLQDS